MQVANQVSWQVVVMGVSGTGKTTVGRRLAEQLGWVFVEGDDLHPAANVAKMGAGQPLTDEDRWPWLLSIAERLTAEAAAGRSVVVTCSALRRSYRDLLREGRPQLVFCHLVLDPLVLADRVARRTDHFMPATLLASQLAVLEPLEADESGIDVSSEGEPAEVVDRVVGALGLGP